MNSAIERDLPMQPSRDDTRRTAFAEGALGVFGDKYGDVVTVYTACDPDGEWYSRVDLRWTAR